MEKFRDNLMIVLTIQNFILTVQTVLLVMLLLKK